MSSPYYPAYDGYYTMSNFDGEQNALKRWFDNYKIDKNAWFATEYETLVVEEVHASARHIKKCQVCLIENIGYMKHGKANAQRKIVMDHTAPPAPILTFAAKRIWQPPPPKTPAELRKEQEFAMMYARGMEPRIRRVPVRQTVSFRAWDFDAMPMLEDTIEYREEIEWVKRSYDHIDAMAMMIRAIKSPTPPAPKHRRNV